MAETDYKQLLESLLGDMKTGSLTSMVSEAVRKAREALDSADLSQIKDAYKALSSKIHETIGQFASFDSAKKVFEETVTDLAGAYGDSIKDLAKYAGSRAGLAVADAGKHSALNQKSQAFYSPVTELNKQAIQANAAQIFGGTDEGVTQDSINKTISSLSKTIGRQAGTLQMEIGISAEDAKKEIGTINQAFVDLQNNAAELSAIELKFGPRAIQGISAISVAAKGLGIGIDTAAEAVKVLTGELGATSQEGLDSLILMQKGARGTGLSVETFARQTLELSKGLSGLGNQTGAVAADFGKFMRKFSDTPGMANAARQAFENVTKSIMNMSDAQRAFIGMGSELGGGGGAIESIINIEEALANKDSGALEKIRQDAIAKVEEMSGSKLLTRKEAVETGQQQLYATQRELAKSVGLGESKAGEYDLLVKGTRGAGSSLEAVTAQDQQAVVERARAVTNLEMSPTELSINKVEGAFRIMNADNIEIMNSSLSKVGNATAAGVDEIMPSGSRGQAELTLNAEEITNKLITFFNKKLGQVDSAQQASVDVKGQLTGGTAEIQTIEANRAVNPSSAANQAPKINAVIPSADQFSPAGAKVKNTDQMVAKAIQDNAEGVNLLKEDATARNQVDVNINISPEAKRFIEVTADTSAREAVKITSGQNRKK